jgi:hypothetical protein
MPDNRRAVNSVLARNLIGMSNAPRCVGHFIFVARDPIRIHLGSYINQGLRSSPLEPFNTAWR